MTPSIYDEIEVQCLRILDRGYAPTLVILHPALRSQLEHEIGGLSEILRGRTLSHISTDFGSLPMVVDYGMPVGFCHVVAGKQEDKETTGI